MKNVAFLTQELITSSNSALNSSVFSSSRKSNQLLKSRCRLYPCLPGGGRSVRFAWKFAYSDGKVYLSSCLDHCSLLIFNHLYVPLTFPNFIRGYLIDTPTAKAKLYGSLLQSGQTCPNFYSRSHLHCFPCSLYFSQKALTDATLAGTIGSGSLS